MGITTYLVVLDRDPQDFQNRYIPSLSFVVALIGRLWFIVRRPTSYWTEVSAASCAAISRLGKHEARLATRACLPDGVARAPVNLSSSSIFAPDQCGQSGRMDPEYTEFGIKIHKLRFTLKVQRRTPTPSVGSEDGRSMRSRTSSFTSTITENLENLGLLPFEPPRSRRPIGKTIFIYFP